VLASISFYVLMAESPKNQKLMKPKEKEFIRKNTLKNQNQSKTVFIFFVKFLTVGQQMISLNIKWLRFLSGYSINLNFGLENPF
jgi:hypothetical protein